MPKLFERIIGVITFILSITVLALAITSTITDKKVESWKETQATIIKKESISDQSKLFEYKLRYHVDEKTYEKELKLTADYEITEEITIKYNPNNHEEITTQINKIGSITEYIVAIVLLLFSLFMFFIGIDKLKEG